jgi:hypothetical protein
MPALGTATAAGGFSSPVFAMSGSSFLSGQSVAVNQKFAWEVQPLGNNTANPSSALSLLYAAGNGGVNNTGFSILPSGSIFSQSNTTVLAKPATATQANPSPKVVFQASAFNSSTAQSVPQMFAFSALPAGNNTPNPTANLSLQFSSGSVAPTPTGLSFSPAGVVNFVPAQTFPGTGTITSVTAASPITGGGSSGAVSVGLDTNALETTLNSQYSQLGAPNTFTQTQTMNQSLTVGQQVNANTVNSTKGYSLGLDFFDTGNIALNNASLGFSFSPSQTGKSNLGIAPSALLHNSIGSENVAIGVNAMSSNTSGVSNIAVGVSALAANILGVANVAIGRSALSASTSEEFTTAVGFGAGLGPAGSQAGGSSNVYIGADAGPGTTAELIDATAIGAGALVNENNALILGPSGSHAISVGIGTPAPLSTYALDVDATNFSPLTNGVVVNGGGGNIFLGMTKGVNKVRADTNGKVFADGGFASSGADFAESVAVRGNRSEYEPGDLLAIDAGGTRRLALARTPYSTLVAGIYSTKPGMLASPHDIDDPRPSTSEVPLAVVGIVPCKVTAENGSIRVGDLLVTSSRAGYAMKGSDRKRLVGSVVGKALEPLAKGTGMIQVLVTLQ